MNASLCRAISHNISRSLRPNLPPTHRSPQSPLERRLRAIAPRRGRTNRSELHLFRQMQPIRGRHDRRTKIVKSRGAGEYHRAHRRGLDRFQDVRIERLRSCVSVGYALPGRQRRPSAAPPAAGHRRGRCAAKALSFRPRARQVRRPAPRRFDFPQRGPREYPDSEPPGPSPGPPRRSGDERAASSASISIHNHAEKQIARRFGW